MERKGSAVRLPMKALSFSFRLFRMAALSSRRHEMARNTTVSFIVDTMIPDEIKGWTAVSIQNWESGMCAPVIANGAVREAPSTATQSSRNTQQRARSRENTAQTRRRKRYDVAGIATAKVTPMTIRSFWQSLTLPTTKIVQLGDVCCK